MVLVLVLLVLMLLTPRICWRWCWYPGIVPVSG